MAALRFPWGGAILFVIAIACLSQQPQAEGAKREDPLTLHTEQATYGGPTQQHIESVDNHEVHPKKDYGLRTDHPKRIQRTSATEETTSRRSTVRRIKVGSRVPVTTTSKPSDEVDDTGDSMLMADAGGKSSGAEDGGNDEKKTLAQQVAEGKYGLIQELLPNTVERPGVISYASNPEVPKDTADNLGGLGQEDIWLAEDHVLVLAGGSFRDKGGRLEQPWPPIDNYVAPRRQVKIPENPRIPPPFPVQLREGEPPRFIGDNAPPFADNIDYPDFQNQGNYPTGPLQPGPWTSNGSYPAELPHRPETVVEPGGPYPSTPLRPQAPGEGPPFPPTHYLPYVPPPIPPQSGNFTQPLRPPVPFPSPGNVTEPFDEDDPSFYYPPPYDFYYPNDNTTEIPPGPLVPGIVLPPPPDFFAPLNQTSRAEKRPPTTKEPPTTKKMHGTDYKTRGNTRQRYRPTIPPKTKVPTTPTPGPTYLPVSTTTVETPTSTPKRVRPIHVKQRPDSRPKVVLQEHANLVTTTQVEVIPATVTPLPFTSEEPEQNVGGKPLDLSKLHYVQEKYPTRNNEPLYYYNGPGISQIVVTSTPRPVFVKHYQDPKGREIPAPTKSPKKQIIYIFTAPGQQDVIANQVSSTELPLSPKERPKYEYIPEVPRPQIDNLGYKSELPTPPRIENFHNIASKDQFYDFLPSPIDPGSSRGFRFPDEVSQAVANVATPTPTNNYLGDLNINIQNLRQFGFENGAHNSKPVVFYSPTAANSVGLNRSGEETNQAFGGQIYVPQVFNFKYRPSTYSSQSHPFSSNSDQEDVTIVTPKPESTYTKTSRQRRPPSRGNGVVSIITVKPSVLYSGPVSAQGNQNHQVENLDLRVNGFKPSTYFIKNNAQENKAQNPSVSIVTPSPQIYNSDSLNEPSYNENPQDEGIRILQNARYSLRPLAALQNPSNHFSSDGSQVIIGENGGHQNDHFPQIYYSSSTPSPPEQQSGIRYLYNDKPAGESVSTAPAPFYDTTPRAPKYISITPEDAKIPSDGRKKIPRPQYEEYFEANRNHSPLSHVSQINSEDHVVPDSVYKQSTTPPTVQTTSRPRFNSQPNFAPYVHGVQTPQNIASSRPPTPIYITSGQQNNNHQFYVRNTPAPPVQQTQYKPQLTAPKLSAEDSVYIPTTPAPIQYHYPINYQQNIAVTTPALDFAPEFNLRSTTYSPLPSYLTTKDVSLFDDATKNYFTIFGQKLGNQEKGFSHRQRLGPTTPLPPITKEYDDSGRGPLVVTTSRPIEPPEERTVVSLVDDIRVNYREPLPPINPNSEFIAPARNQPQPSRPTPSPISAIQNSFRGGGALVSYQLPGVDGQGVGGGSRYYFLTPHSVPSVPQQNPFQQDSRLYNQWQRPVYNNYWRGRRSS